MVLNIGDEIEFKIDRLGINGEGVARRQGITIFVEGALPNEIVKVKIIEKRKNFGRAELLEILRKVDG